jgi:transcriptional regulator with XRE-family HTH domain
LFKLLKYKRVYEPQETTWSNPSILTWRREKLGLTTKGVADLSKELKDYLAIIEEELNSWENQKAEPELEHFETLSEIYVCPAGYFFLKEQPEEYLPLSYRGLATEKQGKLSAVSKQFIGMRYLNTYSNRKIKINFST